MISITYIQYLKSINGDSPFRMIQFIIHSPYEPFLLYRFCRWWGVIYNDSRPMFHLAIVAVLLHDLLRKKKLVGFEFWHDGSDDRILHWEPSDLGIVIEWNVPSGHCLPSRWDHCAGCHRSGGTLWSKIASGLFGGAGWSDPFFFAKNYGEKWMMSTTSKQSF